MSPANTWFCLSAYFGVIIGVAFSIRALWRKWHQWRVQRLRERIFDKSLELGYFQWNCILETFGIQSPEELDEIGDLKGILYQMKRGGGCGGMKI